MTSINHYLFPITSTFLQIWLRPLQLHDSSWQKQLVIFLHDLNIYLAVSSLHHPTWRKTQLLGKVRSRSMGIKTQCRSILLPSKGAQIALQVPLYQCSLLTKQPGTSSILSALCSPDMPTRTQVLRWGEINETPPSSMKQSQFIQTNDLAQHIQGTNAFISYPKQQDITVNYEKLLCEAFQKLLYSFKYSWHKRCPLLRGKKNIYRSVPCTQSPAVPKCP